MKYYGKIQSPQDLITKKYCDNIWINNVAAEYASASTYNKNDVVIYDTKLYKCNTDNTTGTWDATKWTQIKINKAMVLDGPLLRDNGTVHPQAPSLDFGDTTKFPDYDAIQTYVDNNPDQIVTMSSMYSLIVRIHDRFISGDILGMSLLRGDTEVGDALVPADDVTISGDTMVIP